MTTSHIENSTGTAELNSSKVSPAELRRSFPVLDHIYEVSDSGHRINAMDGLRGMAVLLVFFVHFQALFGEYWRTIPALWQTSRFLGIVGNTGVDVFFVLSGYLIYGALLRNKETLSAFLSRRARRIYPTFIAVFILYLGLSVFFPQNSKLSGMSEWAIALYLLQNILFLPGLFAIVPFITVAWTLSYEAAFYITAGLLIPMTKAWRWSRPNRVTVCLLLFVAYLAYSLSVPVSHVRSLMFLVGIVLWEMLGAQRFRATLGRYGEFGSIMLFGASLAYSYLLEVRQDLFAWLPGWNAGRNPTPGVFVYQGPHKVVVLALSLFWLGAFALGFRGLLNAFFCWRPLRYLGRMSYSYYLIHGITLEGVALVWAILAKHYSLGLPVLSMMLPVGFLATWISATLLFLLIEKPFSLRRGPFPGVTVRTR